VNVAVSCVDVGKVYRKHRLIGHRRVMGVDGLSLEVMDNEIFGLLGLNGSGKTTTIKLLLGLLHPDSGELRVLGRRVPDWTVNRHIGYLPESVSFNKRLTGRELLTFFADVAGGVRRDRLDGVVRFVNLSDAIDRRVGEYSKGMLQRLGLAQAIVHDPDVLILDEPSSGLDPIGIKEIRDLIVELKRQGKTVFFSSHLISELEKVCDRVGIIHHGRLLRIVSQEEWRTHSLEAIFMQTLG